MDFAHLEGASFGIDPDIIMLTSHHQRHVPWAFHTGCGFWVEQSDPRVSNAGPALVICGGPGGYPRTVARCWKDRAIRSIRPPRSAYGRAPRHRRPRSHCSAFHCRHGLAPSGHP